MNYLENLQALLAAVEATPDDVIDLAAWTCGTHMCMGGMLSHIEHFKALGVAAHPYGGAPITADSDPDDDVDTYELMRSLFGVYAYNDIGTGRLETSSAYSAIFAGRGFAVWDDEILDAARQGAQSSTLTDKQLGLARLRRAIAHQEAACTN